MFAIKCTEGYLRIISDQEVVCVGLMKASVFGDEGMDRAYKAIETAKKMGLAKLRIVELEIIEKDPLESAPLIMDGGNIMSQELIEKAKTLAADQYRKGEFLCSEAIVYTINQLLGEPLPKEVVKLASGLPVGIGGSGCSCGAVTGGIMALGLALGRTKPNEKCPNIMPASKELHDWFKASNKSICCRILIQDFEFGSKDHLEQCIGFTGEVAGKAMELITKYQNDN